MIKIGIISKITKINVLNQKGMALIATLIFVFILVTFGVALLTMTNNDSKLSTLQKESTRAFYVAETGIEKALWYINFSPDNTAGLDWRTTEDDPPYYTNKELNPEEYFEVVVATDEWDSDMKATKISFISTGRVDKGGEYNKGTRKIKVKLIKGIAQNNSLAYNYAIFTDDYMRINGNIYVNGDIHSNGDIDVSGGSFDLVNGDATAVGTVSGYPSGINGAARQDVPVIIFDDYKVIAQGGGGVYYGDGTSKIFSTNQTLTGIHFVDGDIIIKPPLDKLIIENGAIFATGKITVQGNPDIEIKHTGVYDNPLAIIALGDITLGGNVHGEGVIQTNGSFTLNGTINIEKGCVVADDGIFNGGGGDMNIVYDNGLQDEIVVGTGIEVWKKASWQEVY
jgi:Tfp pilus assembly protein PilX